ncbi:MAG TPA: response regulator [Thermoanaerobaculia bacterium]|nr:response regulator [Thermoanaerobaculia bacterium]
MARTERERPLVLVVDDVEDSRSMVRDFLAFRGFEVAVAEDGEEAVAQARALLPDLILMDVWLPKLDGLSATRQLKAGGDTGHIPIIALTAHAVQDAQSEAVDAGCDAVITKPFFPDDLEKQVRRHLGEEQEE